MCLIWLYNLNTFDDSSSSFFSPSRVWTCVWSTPTASATMESLAIATLTPHLILQSTWATTCLQSLCTALTDLKSLTLSVEIKKRMKPCVNCAAQHLAMISRKCDFYIEPLLLCHLAFFHICIHIDAFGKCVAHLTIISTKVENKSLIVLENAETLFSNTFFKCNTIRKKPSTTKITCFDQLNQ